MNHHIDISKDIERLIAGGRINEALDTIENQCVVLGAVPEMRSALCRVRESYGLMAHYALQGMPDPSRAELYDGIVQQIRSLVDGLHRRSRLEDAPTLYFSTLRTALQTPDVNISAVLGQYRHINQRLQTAMLTEDAAKADREFTLRAEDLERRIFNLVWTSYPLSVDDVAAIGNIFSDPSLPESFKLLVTSAVMMGQLEYYDERRLRLLMDAYTSGGGALSVRALCSLLICMAMSRARRFSPSLRRRFDAIRELPGWESDVKAAMLQFIRTRDTERIGRKFTQDVVPGVMKLRDELEKMGKDKLTIDPELMEENPEWAEILEKNGVADKLKELMALQEDGGDVMMATFSRMKTFPFFNEMPNWFLSFRPAHSVIGSESDSSLRLFADLVQTFPMLCDSDKYSVVLALMHAPEQERKMMSSQLRMNSEQMAAMQMGETLLPAKEREAMIREYVQDLYRFFRLFRRKGEFSDPFATALNLATVPELADVFGDSDTLRLVGEFYFKHGHYADAFDTFECLSYKIPPSAELFQKMGYAKQQTGDISGAVRYYEQSELLNSESMWTVKRLAVCHRQLGHWKEALSFYRRLEKAQPDNTSVAINIALCHMNRGDYAAALPYLYKVEFLAGESDRSSRPLMRALLHTGELEKAVKYRDLVLSRTPQPDDYLAAGALEIACGRLDKGVDYLAESIAARNFDIDSFVLSFSEARSLFAATVSDPLVLSLVLDTAIRRSAKLGGKV